MSEAGLRAIEVAKQTGAWNALDAVEEMQMPDELEDALARSQAAHENFDAFPPSPKKIIFWWIESAKQPETRSKRVQEAVTLTAQNIRANHARQ